MAIKINSGSTFIANPITTTTTTGGLTIQNNSPHTITWNSGMWSLPGTPLTNEERTELERLKSERAAENKKQKLIIFKTLEKTLRQNIVNSIHWNRAYQQMNEIDVSKSQREIDLENKQNPPGTIWVSSPIPFYTSGPSYQIPFGLTEEDVLQAHLEATLEEELLNIKE